MTQTITASLYSGGHSFPHLSDIEKATSEFKRSPSETSLRALIDCSHTAKDLCAIITEIGSGKLFQCKDCAEALALIEPWVQSREALKQAVRMLFLLDRGSLKPQVALWFGIKTDDRTFIQEALTQGADVNAPLYPVMTALQLACDLDNPALAEMLLDLGACVQVVCGTHQHKTPWMSAVRSPAFAGSPVLARIERLDNGFTPEFCARKRLAHQYVLQTEKNTSKLAENSFHHEGARIGLVDTLDLNEEFLRMFQSELRANAGPLLEKCTGSLSGETKEKLQNWLTRAAMCRALTLMLSTLRHCYFLERTGKHADPEAMKNDALKCLAEGRPVVCFGIMREGGRWVTGAPNSHAWGLVITKDQGSENYRVQRCNRGYGSLRHSGIVEKKMTHEEVVQLIEKYYKATHWKKDVFEPEAIGQIDALISTGPEIIYTPQKAQAIGNCCYYSAQSIKLALLLALLPPCIQGEERISFAKAIKREMTLFTRERELYSYLSKRSGLEGKDISLLFSLLQKEKKLSARCLKILSAPPYGLRQITAEFLIAKQRDFASTELSPEEHTIRRLSEEINRLSALVSLGIGNVPILLPLLRQIAAEFLIAKQRIAKQRDSASTELSLQGHTIGGLPEEINRLSAPVRLDASQCELSSIPDSIPLLLPFLQKITAEFLIVEQRIAKQRDSASTELSLKGHTIRDLPEEINRLSPLVRLDASQCELSSIPDLLLPHLESLDLSRNCLTALPRLNLSELQYLHLQSNQLTALPEDFRLDSLQRLDLESNVIERLPSLSLPNLTMLWLSDNRLKELPPMDLPKLITLSLAGNQLTTVPLHIISSSLKGLYLQDNVIEEVSPLSSSNLEVLQLSHNRITSLAGLNLPRLKVLNLNNNLITQLPADITLSSLEKLDIGHNVLQELPPLHCTTLKTLIIADNHLRVRPILDCPLYEGSSNYGTKLNEALIPGFFVSKEKTPPLIEASVEIVTSLFQEIQDPISKVETLFSLYRGYHIKQETLDQLFSAILPDAIEKISQEETISVKKLHFIGSIFDDEERDDGVKFPLPTEEQMQSLLSIFEEMSIFHKKRFVRYFPDTSPKRQIVDRFIVACRNIDDS